MPLRQAQGDVRGEPVRISVCHCLACQRRTGGPFAAQARFPTDRVSVEGAPKAWTWTADSGATATYRFCPECGSTVTYVLDKFPYVVAVLLGAFAYPTFPPPRFSV